MTITIFDKTVVTFFNEAGEAMMTAEYANEKAATDALEYEDGWPASAANATMTNVYRRPVYGIDYGNGSIKNGRFGGGYVPRKAYQFNG